MCHKLPTGQPALPRLRNRQRVRQVVGHSRSFSIMAMGAEAVQKGVAILADDLTGALDAAAPFALPTVPVDVFWDAGEPPPSGGFAFDSETRELPSARAEAAIGTLAPYLTRRGLALKKIDSLLRGNTIIEVAACWRT